ncbi:MAG: carbamate kinase, partial [Candidatus Promineifilaceae bacterium]
MNTPIAVIAIGGNALIKDPAHQTVADQHRAAGETAGHIAAMIASGWRVVISHGNGPQVGFILRRSELAAHELHEVPLDACVADTQGALGYTLQQELYNHFLARGMAHLAATLVTQVEVAADDPAFGRPSKPIGSFMEAAQARRRRAEGWQVFEDAGRGWRRVVPSPRPVRIVEEEAIRELVAAGVTVIAAGGGGIPVVARPDGQLEGVAAVIDKDLASALLAARLAADLFLICTSVEKVALNFGRPDQRWLDRLTLAEARTYLDAGIHFAQGS